MISGIIGTITGVVAALFLLIGLVPLLGWLNWITSLPLAFVGLIFSRISARRPGSILGSVGTVINIGVIVVALLRLLLGGGIL